jgi:hypothetical protein
MAVDGHPAAEPDRAVNARAAEPLARLPAATNAPSAIGSLAASFAVLEGQKLLEGAYEDALIGRELYLDARYHQYYLTRLTRNRHCRFDHETWAPSEVGALTLGEALGLGGAAPLAGDLGAQGEACASDLGFAGDAFVSEITCFRCGRQRQLWKLRQRLAPMERTCLACGEALVFSGFDLVERLSAERLAPEILRRPLFDFGLRPGDVFSIRTGGGEAHYQLALGSPAPPGSGVTAVLAGCGNIGSHLVPHLARMPGVGRVVLADPDVYERENLAGQDIRGGDLGRKKVDVQAERLHQIRPELEVVAVADGLETLPLAYFRDTIVFGALDSRLARLWLNQAAWRAGSPWIDTAVDGPGLLCRVSVYRPGRDSPCLECGWDAADYRSLHQVLPCDEIAVTEDREGDR